MKKYHVKVAVQILEIYEVEANDPETAADDWSFGWLAPILCTRRCESRINRYRCVLGPA